MRIDQIPRAWLMTDERLGDRLWPAIDRLRRGDGLLLRHYHTPDPDRTRLAERMAAIAADRGLVLSIASDPDLARRLGAPWVHRPLGNAAGLAVSMPAHSLAEATAARADLLFVSPVRATRSHPGRPALGERAFAIARSVAVPCIALGGMDAAIFDRDYRRDFYGWAGIDAWIRI